MGFYGMVTPRAGARVYWIDGLKAVVVVGIALFHAALVFAPGTWIVNNAARSFWLGVFAGFTFQWGIALLFLLSGAATWFGLRSRSAVQFAKSRIVRLGIPLLAGLVVLSPLQSYVQHTQAMNLGGLAHTYATFWTTVHATLSPSSAYDVVYHLWFLTHLMAISIATLPVLWWLRSESGRAFGERALALVQLPAGFLAGALPFAAVQVALHPKFPLYQDWSDLAAWSVLYVEGFFIMSDARFAAVLRRSLWPALITAVFMLLVTGLLSASGSTAAIDAHPEYSVGYLVDQALRSVTTWCWLVFLVGLGVRWLDHGNRLTDWGADRPLPFYVLSHPIIVVLARYVVGWQLGVWAKFVILAALSIGITLALCELVSRYRVTRLLFGLSAMPKPRHAAPARPLTLGTPSAGPRASGL